MSLQEAAGLDTLLRNYSTTSGSQRLHLHASAGVTKQLREVTLEEEGQSESACQKESDKKSASPKENDEQSHC